MLEVLVSLVMSIARSISTTPGSQSMVLNCLGRNEVFFEFDYFITGGHDRNVGRYCHQGDIENTFGKWFYFFALLTGFILKSNLFEIYLIGKVMYEMKESTINSGPMLSRKAFQERKR